VSPPKQKPGRSKQDYGTPSEFIAAVEGRFGPLDFDLACTAANKVATDWPSGGDAFAITWSDLGRAWLNPPFSRIEPWARRCAETRLGWSDRIFMLTPASVGANWFAEHVHGKALVLGLSPRLVFVGEKDPYPKDLILSCYGEHPGFDVWRWR
jgi:phage N-6-adenine-methyltransferase